MTVLDRTALFTGFLARPEGFDLVVAGECRLAHRTQSPAVTLARGEADIRMFRGNFVIEDAPKAEARLVVRSIDAHAVQFACAETGAVLLTVRLRTEGARQRLEFEPASGDWNRLRIAWSTRSGEWFWGGGEQMSYLALNGRRFPMWTSEPGVGRDKSRELTRAMDESGLAGGDYYTTNYPQPTFLSSEAYAVHLEAEAYSVLDFSHADRVVIESWQTDMALDIFVEPDLKRLVGRLSEAFGRQPPLPDWAISGAIIGLKDGVRSFERLERIIEAGTAVSGLWCEDWVGIRQTSFGRRLFWDWRAHKDRYPDLKARITALKARGIHFLGYVNPYIAEDGVLFAEARDGRHLALKPDEDVPQLVDFGEFYCGIVDFTRAETCDWFADRVIGREMIDFGLDGWMADFGEYLPIDVRLHDGSDPMRAHNRWPVLWAKVNADAVRSRGRTGDVVFFMRAGFSGVQAHCPLLWAGDQLVDFSRHDGLGTALTGALSSGLVGNAYHHGDIGGYTSLMGVVRTPDLIKRWAEYAAFTPMFRSHEGNRPDDNLQIDSAPDILSHFAAMSRVHAALAPLVRALGEEARKTGLPLQRPMFLHAPDMERYAMCQDQYFYGPDLVVAPVIDADMFERVVDLPVGIEWVHVWSGKPYLPGVHKVAAPYGAPPAFYRKGSPFTDLFARLADARGDIA